MIWFCWLKTVGWNTHLYPRYRSMGTQFCAVSKFGNCTRTHVTRFGSTAGYTKTVAKPSNKLPAVDHVNEKDKLDEGWTYMVSSIEST